MSWREEAKKSAALRAVSELVEDGMVIGLGSGTTMTYVVEELARRAQVGILDELSILAEARSFLARELGAEEVLVFREDDPDRYDPKGRSRLARPYRPAIYIE